MKLQVISACSLLAATLAWPALLKAECDKLPRPPIPISQALCGIAVDTTGELLTDAQITLARKASSEVIQATTSDSRGHFVFHGVPAGEYFLSSTGFAPAMDFLKISDTGPTACRRPIGLILGISQECQSRITTGGGIRVKLDVKVAAQVEVDSWNVTTIEPGGKYEYIELLPGPHRVEITAPGYQTTVFEITTREYEAVKRRVTMQPMRP